MWPAKQSGGRAVPDRAQGFGTAPVYVRSGGSIPIVLTFKEILGLESVLMGYGLPDDGAHGPDEKMHLPDFHRGCRTSAIFFAEVATQSQTGERS